MATPCARGRGRGDAPHRPRARTVVTDVARVLFLGPARDAAGVREAQIDAPTLAAVLREAVTRYGQALEAVLAVSQVWVNGVEADPDTAVGPYDEVAVLPPVSGGC